MVARRRRTALPNKAKAEHPPTPLGSDESNVVVHQMRMSPQGALIRERMAAARERKMAIAAEREAKTAADEERRRSATNALHDAFAQVVSRQVTAIDPQWAIDRYAELGIAACKADDLGTIRGVLSDLMKHAKDQPPPPTDDDTELLASAVAQLGPEAVELAARKAGLEVVRPDQYAQSVDWAASEQGSAYDMEGPSEPEPRHAPPISHAKARMLAALSKTE